METDLTDDGHDSVDGIVRAWHDRDAALDSSTLEVIGRLLLCAEIVERTAGGVLRRYGLSIADFDVVNTLRRLAHPHGTKPGELARSSMITSGAMTSRLDRLERAGLIRRTPDPDDRRGVLVRLTASGGTLARDALHALIAANEEFLAPLDGAQRSAVASALKRLLLHHEPRRASAATGSGSGRQG